MSTAAHQKRRFVNIAAFVLYLLPSVVPMLCLATPHASNLSPSTSRS